jgi:hypothetical protein
MVFQIRLSEAKKVKIRSIRKIMALFLCQKRRLVLNFVIRGERLYYEEIAFSNISCVGFLSAGAGGKYGTEPGALFPRL